MPDVLGFAAWNHMYSCFVSHGGMIDGIIDSPFIAIRFSFENLIECSCSRWSTKGIDKLTLKYMALSSARALLYCVCISQITGYFTTGSILLAMMMHASLNQTMWYMSREFLTPFDDFINTSTCLIALRMSIYAP